MDCSEPSLLLLWQGRAGQDKAGQDRKALLISTPGNFLFPKRGSKNKQPALTSKGSDVGVGVGGAENACKVVNELPSGTAGGFSFSVFCRLCGLILIWAKGGWWAEVPTVPAEESVNLLKPSTADWKLYID